MWQTSLASVTPHAKAEYKAASRAAHKSAVVDHNQYFTFMLIKVQHSVRKGDTHPAYKALKQLNKPKCQLGRQLRHGISGRQLRTVSERIVEWLRHVIQLFTIASPIALEVLALLPLPAPHLPSDHPYPEVTSDEVVTAIKRLKNNKSPGSATSCQRC